MSWLGTAGSSHSSAIQRPATPIVRAIESEWGSVKDGYKLELVNQNGVYKLDFKKMGGCLINLKKDSDEYHLIGKLNYIPKSEVVYDTNIDIDFNEYFKDHRTIVKIQTDGTLWVKGSGSPAGLYYEGTYEWSGQIVDVD